MEMFARKIQDQFSPTEVTRTEKFMIEGVGENCGCGTRYANPCGNPCGGYAPYAPTCAPYADPSNRLGKEIYRSESYLGKVASTEAALAATNAGARASKGTAWGLGIGSLILVIAGVGATAYAASRASTLDDEKNGQLGKLLGWGVDSGIPTRFNY